jgi:hypothetical protein
MAHDKRHGERARNGAESAAAAVAKKPDTTEQVEATTAPKKSLWTEIVSSLGGAIAALVLFSAVVGWQTSQSYFAVLGADWIVPLLSTSQRLQLALAPIVLFASVILLATSLAISPASALVDHTRNVLFWIIGVGGALQAVLVIRHIYPMWAYVMGLLVTCSWSFAFAIMTAWAFAARREDAPSRLRRFNLLVTIGFFTLPQLWGGTQAQRDLNAETCALPKVQVAGPSGDWRLLTVIESGAVVMLLPAKGKDAQLRIVAPQTVTVAGRAMP